MVTPPLADSHATSSPRAAVGKITTRLVQLARMRQVRPLRVWRTTTRPSEGSAWNRSCALAAAISAVGAAGGLCAPGAAPGEPPEADDEAVDEPEDEPEDEPGDEAG